jgi:S-DNA-T family DNA segregation ATPase FtsK/SpoIIIE
MRRVVDRLQDQSEETGREYTLKDVRDAYVKKHGERSYVPKIDADDIEYEVPDEYAEFEKKEIDLSDLYDVEEVEEPDVDVEAEFEPDIDLETGEVDVEFASDEEVEDALGPVTATEPEVPEPEEEPIEPEEPEVEIEFPEEDTLDLADELEDEFEEEPPEPTDDISDLVNKALHDRNLESRERPETDTEDLADVVNRVIQHGASDVPRAADETEEAVEADETEEATDTINDVLGDENEEEVDDIINRILDGQ